MPVRNTVGRTPRTLRGKLRRDQADLTRRLLLFAAAALPRQEFLKRLSQMFIDGTGCDAVEIRTTHDKVSYVWSAVEAGGSLQVSLKYFDRGRSPEEHLTYGDEPAWGEIRGSVARRRFDRKSPYFTGAGSFWTGDGTVPRAAGGAETPSSDAVSIYKSVAIMRFQIDADNYGLWELKSKTPHFFARNDLRFYEEVAQALAITLAERRAQRALRERIKELSCLYVIAQSAQQAETTLEDVLTQVVAVLPSAFPYPELIRARITLDTGEYTAPGFVAVAPRLESIIEIDYESIGKVEVVSLEARTEDRGVVFIEEEQRFLDAAAREVAMIVGRRLAERERVLLEEQLRRADRLATIGQLAAGVAHELNEPLGNILGFAELLVNEAGVAGQAARDTQRIIAATLHAREVVKKLLIFGRQMPTQKKPMDLNAVVDEGLYFLEGRAAQEGIKIVRALASGLPRVNADGSQIQQVVVNLVVNAIQAINGGGTITVTTAARRDDVVLTIADTGVGMNADVKNKIFLPFFTTKDIGQGTGLGLSVVHGIVTAHGGTIDVWSREGEGSRFTVTLPAGSEDEPPGEEGVRNG